MMRGGMQWSFAAVVVGLVYLLHAVVVAEANIGINYGRVADNLPRPKDVAKLVQSIGVKHIKIFDYEKEIIQAFDHTGINLIVCVPNQEIIGFAQSEKAARTWVHNHIRKRVLRGAKITYIVVGNEILSGIPEIWPALVPAMWQIHSGLVYYGLDHLIKVSTPHSMGVMGASYPPSAGVFAENIRTSIMEPMLRFLKLTGSTLMMNIYPYFPYRDDPVNISPGYALFLNNATGVDDPNTGLHYSNLFDAMLDSSIFAMKNLGYHDIPVMVTETGWPSLGEEWEKPAGLENAKTFNNNLLKHVKSGKGTPARPDTTIQIFIFALFNEYQKPGPLSERNFGLFYPNKTKVYDISFT